MQFLVQSLLAAPLVALFTVDLKFLKSDRGTEPGTILYVRQIFLYMMRFSQLSSFFFLFLQSASSGNIFLLSL